MANHSRILQRALNNSQWTAENEAAILAPYIYLLSAPSKEVVKHTAFALNDWLQVEPAKLELIISIAIAAQNDSLLFDDIEDGSELRRGKPGTYHPRPLSRGVFASSYDYDTCYACAI